MKKLSFKYRLIKTIICLVLLISLIVIFNFYNNAILKFTLFFALYLYVGYVVIIKSFKNLKNGKIFDENFLMLIASVGALILSDYSEAVAVLLFYEVGELFQGYAVNKARKSISELMSASENSFVERNGQIELVDSYEVEEGETIVIKNGESVPIDGIILDGDGYLDSKVLTGESVPNRIVIGEKVLSGTIFNGGVLKVKTTTTYENSTINRICEMVQNISSNKSKTEGLLTKFSKYYTPIVIVLSVITFIMLLLFKINVKDALFRALSFLVISCPCALVISIPITFFGGLASSSKQGILIKGSVYIEKLANAKNFAFDKTGTLTKGEFEIVNCLPKDKSEELLYLASLCESCSVHPIAKSILKRGIVVDSTGFSFQEIEGKGIIAKNNNEEILCGSAQFLLENGVKISKNNTIYTEIYIAKNKQYLGCILIGDTIKPEAKFVVDKLQKKGKVAILSGDSKKVVEHYSNQLFVKQYFYELLPHEKSQVLDKLMQENNNNFCFVGDGINDVVSLVKSDIGIALGGSADVALEHSDIVLTSNNLNQLLKAKQICKKVMKIIKQNVVISLGIKFLVMLLASFGFANMWLAIFADVGVSFLAILNAMRTFIIPKKIKCIYYYKRYIYENF